MASSSLLLSRNHLLLMIYLERVKIQTIQHTSKSLMESLDADVLYNTTIIWTFFQQNIMFHLMIKPNHPFLQISSLSYMISRLNRMNFNQVTAIANTNPVDRIYRPEPMRKNHDQLLLNCLSTLRSSLLLCSLFSKQCQLQMINSLADSGKFHLFDQRFWKIWETRVEVVRFQGQGQGQEINSVQKEVDFLISSSYCYLFKKV